MSSTPTILIADDQRDVLEALRLLLKSEGIAVQAVSSPDEAVAAAKKSSFGVALIDLNYTRDTTSGAEGLELTERLRAVDADLPIVVMTAWGSIDLAVRAMRAGAADFVEKPWENQRLIAIVRAQLELNAARGRERRLRRENELLRAADNGELIAEAPAMRQVIDLVRRVAPSEANVLITGENGSGKGVIADLLHRNSRRAAAAFIKVNMGGISESVFESEMFGHVRGAFTDAKSDRVGRFEVADGGTLFLDEIGNIPLPQQPKLLRVLEDRELERLGSSRTLSVDVRVVSATNSDLALEVAAGRFRKDLLYRLNTVEIPLPALRERSADIIPLARRFLARYARRYVRDDLRLSPTAERALLAYAWPGNVRELDHAMERAVLVGAGDQIEAADLALASCAAVEQTDAPSAGDDQLNLNLDRAEERMVRQALQLAEGNVQQAAHLLGLSRGALYRRLERFGIAT